MFTTQVYLYKQKHQVVLRDTTTALTSMRYNPVYAKNLKLHRGTDNVLVFTFVNQDQKPVNNSTATFTFRLINREGSDVLLAKTMTAIDATKGTASITVTEQELDTVNTQRAHYTIERSLTTSDLNDVVFVDDQLGGRGVIEIVDSVMPTHTESTTITIPAFYDGPGVTTHYSSEWHGTNDVQTLQYKPSAFTGKIQVEGATADDNLRYDIGTELSLTASSTTGYITILGYHPFLRLRIEETSGSISEIKIR